MAKKDIRTDSLLAWDEYKDKPPEVALPAIYSHAGDISKAKCTWYWESIKVKRLSSHGILLSTLILLIIGTLLPILAGLGDNPAVRLQYTQLGVAALAFAGLLQVADRVFGWSSGWLRYITTVTAMENLTRKFELDWASYIVEKGTNIGTGDVKPLFDLAKEFEDSISKLQSDETDKWVTEFSSSVSLLGELIKSQRESGEKQVEAALVNIASQQKAAQEAEKVRQKGAVEVNIAHKAAPIAVNISIDRETAQEFVGLSWVKADLQPGQHTISVVTTGAIPQTIQKIVDIPPGGVAHTEVKLF
jgi:SMODS and SLOG-associating 2TM effector domain 2